MYMNFRLKLTWAEGSSELSDWNLSVVHRRYRRCRKLFYIFMFFSGTTGQISTKLGTMHPWVEGIRVCWNEGPRLFPRGDDYEIVKIHWQNLKIFFSKTTGPISTKLGTKHPLLIRTHVHSNEGFCPFQRGDIYGGKTKIHWKNLKIFSRATGPISTKLGTTHSWVKIIQVFFNWRTSPISKER